MKFPALPLFLFAAPFLLASCDEQPHKPPVPHTGEAKPAPVLLDGQRNALDKARAVEPALDDAAQRKREAIEKGVRGE